MTVGPDNLILRDLRRIDAKMDGMSETLREHGHRLTRIETSLASIRREQANDAEAVALSSVRMDRLGGIERRREIADAAGSEPGGAG